jgi:hypothetical protein
MKKRQKKSLIMMITTVFTAFFVLSFSVAAGVAIHQQGIMQEEAHQKMDTALVSIAKTRDGSVLEEDASALEEVSAENATGSLLSLANENPEKDGTSHTNLLKSGFKNKIGKIWQKLSRKKSGSVNANKKAGKRLANMLYKRTNWAFLFWNPVENTNFAFQQKEKIKTEESGDATASAMTEEKKEEENKKKDDSESGDASEFSIAKAKMPVASDKRTGFSQAKPVYW